MAQRWYYARGGQKIGPVTSQELRYLAASGTLQPADLVWVEGNDRGKEARSVVGLFPAANGEGPPEPPPLPEGRVANAGYTEGGITAGGSLAEKLGNLTETTKAAARLAAAQARKAHLVNVTLRAAYLDLGRDIYAAGRFRDEFPEEYAEIAEVERRIEQLTSARPQVNSSGGLADRATKAAAGVKATALSMKKESLLRRLGELSYVKAGDRSGPGPMVHRIADDLLKLGQLDEHILQLSKIGQGRLVTPRRVLVGTAGVGLVMLIALAPRRPNDQPRSDHDGTTVARQFAVSPGSSRPGSDFTRTSGASIQTSNSRRQIYTEYYRVHGVIRQITRYYIKDGQTAGNDGQGAAVTVVDAEDDIQRTRKGEVDRWRGRVPHGPMEVYQNGKIKFLIMYFNGRETGRRMFNDQGDAFRDYGDMTDPNL